jgi:hypothetical protein
VVVAALLGSPRSEEHLSPQDQRRTGLLHFLVPFHSVFRSVYSVVANESAVPELAPPDLFVDIAFGAEIGLSISLVTGTRTVSSPESLLWTSKSTQKLSPPSRCFPRFTSCPPRAILAARVLEDLFGPATSPQDRESVDFSRRMVADCDQREIEKTALGHSARFRTARVLRNRESIAHT